MRRLLSGKRKNRGVEPASLAERMTGALPLPSRRGRAEVTDWLSGIALTPSGKRCCAGRRACGAEEDPRRHCAFRALSVGPCRGRSGAFAAAFGQRSGKRFGCPPCRHARRSPTAKGAAALMRVLRRFKAEAALLIALADIGGVWPVARVTARADRCCRHSARRRRALSPARRRRARQARSRRTRRQSRGGLRLHRARHGQDGRPTSSIIPATSISWCSSMPAAPTLAPDVEPAPFYVRVTRDLVEAFAGAHRRTATCFASICGCVPIRRRRRSRSRPQAALDYYESRGQNWERAALIKARACAGDLAAGERLLARSVARSSGANISITLPLPTCMR